MFSVVLLITSKGRHGTFRDVMRGALLILQGRPCSMSHASTGQSPEQHALLTKLGVWIRGATPMHAPSQQHNSAPQKPLRCIMIRGFKERPFAWGVVQSPTWCAHSAGTSEKIWSQTTQAPPPPLPRPALPQGGGQPSVMAQPQRLYWEGIVGTAFQPPPAPVTLSHGDDC